jgi:8-hydroxy-5-deazaflavin:NADPH oxidoreductase
MALGSIAVIGGTGKLGSAIGRRLAKAGCQVIIGSRSADSAAAAAKELGFGLTGMSNADAAKAASLAIVTVPFAAQEGTLAEIAPHVAGKIVIDTTVPLMPPKVMRVQLPPEGSAAQRAQKLLGANVTVVSAFHGVAAHKLITDQEIQCDVLVFGDDKEARAQAVAIVEKTGLRAIQGGALANSAAAEAMTSVLIFINKTYQVDGAGVVITGQLVF